MCCMCWYMLPRSEVKWLGLRVNVLERDIDGSVGEISCKDAAKPTLPNPISMSGRIGSVKSGKRWDHQPIECR